MNDHVLTERARIEEQVAGRTLVDALAETVRTYPDEAAYSDKHHVPEGESWRTLTWTETRELALDVAAGLIELGVGVGDTVAIMATNRIEHFLADMGGVHAAATPMSIYNTLSPEQVAYVAGHAEPTVAVLENADHLARWARALDECASVRKVVVLDADGRAGGRAVRVLGGLRGGGRGVPLVTRRRGRRPGSGTAARRPGDHPLHVRHDREPEGRGAHPPQRALRGDQHPRGGRPRGRADRDQLPAARAHRRAGARAVRPAGPGQPHVRHRRPRRAAGRARRGPPDQLLRGATRLGEDQDRHLREARSGPEPRQRQARAGLDGGRAGLGRGAGRRRDDDPGDRGGVPPGRRGDPRLPQAAARARPGGVGGLRGGTDAARGREVHGRARDHGLRRLRHDRDLRRDHGQRAAAASSSAPSAAPRRAWR